MANSYIFTLEKNKKEALLLFPQSKIGFAYPEMHLLNTSSESAKACFMDLTLGQAWQREVYEYEALKKSTHNIKNINSIEVLCKEKGFNYEPFITILSDFWGVSKEEIEKHCKEEGLQETSNFD